jgi:hypothetical protein
MSEGQKPIQTGGGAYIDGDVSTKGGDFVGRDKIELNIYPGFTAAPGRLRRTFDALMVDKIQGFVGRQFVFDALDGFLRTHHSGYYIIRGEPGIGKSALMAKLVNERGYLHHFNIASQNIRSPRIFLENICAQLIERFNLPYLNILPTAFDDSGFLMECLDEAVKKLRSQETKIIIAVDALDEVDRKDISSAANVLFLPPSLPSGVFFVVTTRPLDDIRLQVMQQKVLDLESDSAGNLKDITAYIHAYVERNPMQTKFEDWGTDRDHFVARLCEKSQGNFMYLYHVLPAIHEGQFVHGGLDELPDGLVAYYQRHWRQMRAGNEPTFDSIYEPIVCILGVAREPVSVQQISNWTNLSPGRVKKSLRRWQEFLETEKKAGEHYYRIYHASFQDFLRDQVDLVRYDSLIVDYYLSLSE